MKAMYIKELRDVSRWLPLGALFAIIMAYHRLPESLSEAANFERQLSFPISIAASVIAVALGLPQSFFDAKNDSRGYLLHRPLAPSTVYWSKVAAGFTAFAASLAIPFAGLALYTEMKGIEGMP